MENCYHEKQQFNILVLFMDSGLCFQRDDFLISPRIDFSDSTQRPPAGASKDTLQVQNFPQTPQSKLQPLHIGQFRPQWLNMI